jgi:hypothetical protein
LLDLDLEIGESRVEIDQEIGESVSANEWRERIEDGAAFDFEPLECRDVSLGRNFDQRVNVESVIFFANHNDRRSAAPPHHLWLINLSQSARFAHEIWLSLAGGLFFSLSG